MSENNSGVVVTTNSKGVYPANTSVHFNTLKMNLVESIMKVWGYTQAEYSINLKTDFSGSVTHVIENPAKFIGEE